MLELTQQVKLIKNRADFIMFVKDPATYLEAHPSEQSAQNVIPYLESTAAWTNDMDGYYENLGEGPSAEPSWRTLGEILIAALFYE